MRIIFCTKGDRLLPSSRTRAHLVADYLRTQGYDAESFHIKTRPWWSLTRERFSELLRNVRLLLSVQKADILYLHKTTDQADFMVLVLLRRWFLRRGYILDFDDAIFLGSVNRAFKTWLMVKNADAVIVGSHFLQEYALKYNKNAHVISAPIDTEDVYLPATSRTGDARVRIGWTGTPGHYENMKLLLDPLQRIVNDGHAVVFVQLGGGDKIHELITSVKGLTVEYTASLAWNEPKTVVAYLQQFDIGVMPLQKTELNRGKDAWKAKEYMGCAVATILSDWGENPYVVTNEVNGLLVNTPDEWYGAFKKLITDEEYRRRIGAAGRAHMAAEFSYKSFMPKLQAIIGRAA
ncbi:MAG: glycosyl transferase, group 1 family protein [Candidatus Kaiserbacteria bacterium]|nr:glycosyl transferase, group 1 family protein [Candidatus Kaiserbacteria bacterium]